MISPTTVDPADFESERYLASANLDGWLDYPLGLSDERLLTTEQLEGLRVALELNLAEGCDAIQRVQRVQNHHPRLGEAGERLIGLMTMHQRLVHRSPN